MCTHSLHSCMIVYTQFTCASVLKINYVFVHLTHLSSPLFLTFAMIFLTVSFLFFLPTHPFLPFHSPVPRALLPFATPTPTFTTPFRRTVLMVSVPHFAMVPLSPTLAPTAFLFTVAPPRIRFIAFFSSFVFAFLFVSLPSFFLLGVFFPQMFPCFFLFP